jgi:hypothetical protein
MCTDVRLVLGVSVASRCVASPVGFCYVAEDNVGRRGARSWRRA